MLFPFRHFCDSFVSQLSELGSFSVINQMNHIQLQQGKNMSTTSIPTSLFSLTKNPIKPTLQNFNFSITNPNFTSISKPSSPIPTLSKPSSRHTLLLSSCISTATHYEFNDGPSEVELRLAIGSQDYVSTRDIVVDSDDSSLIVKVKNLGSVTTLIETNSLFDKIKPAETIWYIDDDQLVINLTKQDPELKWPHIVESWESLTAGLVQLLKGTSIYVVGPSTDINQKVANKLAVALGYTPLDTQELLETFAKQTIDSWVVAEGPDSVAEAESAILESLSSHVRTVVSTLGGRQGASGRTDKWQHLYAGFTIWLSQTDAKEDGKRRIQEGYSNADVAVKIEGWSADNVKSAAQASLSALKQLILSDKKLTDKKRLYIRLGCRGDWPNIEPPGWDPSAEGEATF
ncbi:probable inactive shikimate kinase like 2, chloroplastic [Mercurialis annua]|uniref:probable inactive shikimate kinase like 2, chloroplastic n=1 Tax=Mercurialis annua TaxID=3986 RepID=UPI002160F68E|nr:probable inactive shikimate kinase like 2, chloroplastic [Mercurialis annua]